MRKLAAAGAALGLALAGATIATPAQAASHKQTECNSGASDYDMAVWWGGDPYHLAPGKCVTVTNGSASVGNNPYVVLYGGQSFRVRYNAFSGPYGYCQDLPNDGSGKGFWPAQSPQKIDYLMYRLPGCKH